MKSIRLNCINYTETFEDANGHYYDYAAAFYAASPQSEQTMTNDLIQKGWREIQTNTGIRVFLQDRRVVRIYRIWG